MTGLWTGVLLAAAFLLLAGGRRPGLPLSVSSRQNPSRRRRVAVPGVGPGKAGRNSKASEEELHRLPLLVHQLAGLLEAGRTPAQLWADASRLYRDTPGAPVRSPVSSTLDRAARAAALGISAAPVLREAAQASSGLHAMLWNDLAACVQTAERSGAPLAGILSRYAQGLESILDSRAARTSALSGPKATVRLLTWLPLAGIGLGFLLGTNPLAVLAQSPVGWAAAGTGAALGLTARLWSRRLISRAVPEGEGTG